MAIDPQRLARFSPLDTLTGKGLRQVAEAISLRSLDSGETLFRKGDRDGAMYFLLAGRIALRSDPTSPVIRIEANGESAQGPLSRLKPRRYDASAEGAATVAVIDEDWLDNLLTVDQTAAYEVTEIPGEDPEWMFRLITSPAFASVPSANFATLFSRLEAVDAKAGQFIVRQNEPGDYYYIIRHGRAEVWRATDGGKPAKLADLGVGDAFGEEALLSGEPRNATVLMAETGQLMRLAMADFNALLRPALVPRINLDQAVAMIGNGARFLDVRGESEFRAYSLPSSINLPLSNLRLLSSQLERPRKYIAVCQTGRRATAAAFLLNQRGFDVRVLDGGLNAGKMNPDTVSKSGNS
jgi:CRP-like cAMP-binding protein